MRLRRCAGPLADRAGRLILNGGRREALHRGRAQLPVTRKARKLADPAKPLEGEIMLGRNMFFARSSTLALAAASFFPASAAYAQATPATGAAPPAGPQAITNPVAAVTNPPAQAEPAAPETMIIITGSRVGRTSFNAPQPVNVLSAQQMANQSIATVGDALNQLPSFRATTTPSANLYRVGASVAARTMDLRGLGPNRTLVLVNGRRLPFSSDNGTVDLNQVPSILVARTEVVTGGASAAYGADAVAGVVNVILDTKLDGLKAEASAGTSKYGDGKEFYAAVAGGSGFAADRGHTVLGIEWYRQNGIGDLESRPWGRRHVNYVSNSGWPGNGDPAIIVSPDAVFILTPGSVITGGPLAGTQFDASGNPVPFQFGSPRGGILQVGGDPSITGAYLLDETPLLVPNRHISLFSHTTYEITPSVSAVLEGSYAWVKGGPTKDPRPFDFGVPIKLDNAFLPDSMRQRMIDAGVTSVPVSRYSTELPPQNVGTSINKTYRLMFGLNGSVFRNWNWDASYEFGRSHSDTDVLANRITSHWNNAIDAVAGPDGTVVCRSTLTNPGNGCIPINFLGVNPENVAALPYVYGDGWQTRTFKQQQAELNLRGSLFDLGAGPVSVAVGGNWRRTDWRGDVDDLSAAHLFTQNYATGLPAGKQGVTEEYAEVNIPLLRGRPGAQALEVDAAVRHSHYTVSGSANPWKLGALYRPVDGLMFRVTRSNDIRAPVPSELSTLETFTALPLNDPLTKSTYFMNVITTGNPNLKLERAKTFTAGGVIQPGFLPGFSVSLDYYNIKIQDAIDVLSAASTINLCAAGQQQLCPFVVRDPGTGLITSVTTTYQNLSALRTAGWELAAEYNKNLADISPGLSGNLNLVLNANRVNHLTTISPDGTKVEYSNWTGNPGSIQSLLGVPRWRANFVTTYSNSLWRLTAAMRYIPKGILDPTKIGAEQSGYSQALPNSANLNHVDPAFYLDLTGGMFFNAFGGKQGEVYLTVNNVFDKSPPDTLRLFGNPLYFDPIGRFYKAGIRIKFK
jgi:outer membrane receptor protein involved in Fe transport